jgi:hypothetical protein
LNSAERSATVRPRATRHRCSLAVARIAAPWLSARVRT